MLLSNEMIYIMHLAQCPTQSKHVTIDSSCFGCWVGVLFPEWILRMKGRLVFLVEWGTLDSTAEAPRQWPRAHGCHRQLGLLFPTHSFSRNSREKAVGLAFLGQPLKTPIQWWVFSSSFGRAMKLSRGQEVHLVSDTQ